ncbi:MAG: hypothetical protein AAFN76_09165 [Pseudomonadota bacterium]
MIIDDSQARGRRILLRGGSLYWTCTLFVLALMTVAFLYIFGPQFADITYLLIVNERMIDGERLYVDVRDINPPFSVWLYTPYAYLAKLTAISPYFWLGLGLVLTLTLSLTAINHLMNRGLNIAPNDRLKALALIALVCLFIMPVQTAQREHFCAIAALPFFYLLGSRLQTKFRPQVWVALAIGAGAGTLLVLKPHYLFGFGLPLLFVAWHRRDWRLLFVPEAWALGFTVVGYWICVYFIVPDFFTHMLPIALDTYQLRPFPFSQLAMTVLFFYGTPLILLLWLVRELKPISPTIIVLAIASAGFLIGFFWQGKGWPYHLYPALLTLLSSILFAWQSGASQTTNPAAAGRMLRLSAAVVVYIAYLSTSGYRSAIVPKEVIALKEQRPSTLFITGDIGISAPVARAINAKWVERDPSDYIAVLAQKYVEDESWTDKGSLETFVSNWIDYKANALVTKNPDLIVVDLRNGKWVELVLADPRISQGLDNYTVISRTDQLRYLSRNDLLASNTSN